MLHSLAECVTNPHLLRAKRIKHSEVQNHHPAEFLPLLLVVDYRVWTIHWNWATILLVSWLPFATLLVHIGI
jgi:hypothetical protein